MEAISKPPVAYSPLSGFGDILRSEFTKLRSVRSTYWTLFAAVVFTVGLAAIGALVVSGNYAHFSGREKADFNPTRLSLGGVNLAQIAIGVLGVLVITSEYGTGMIRATLSAVPQRRLMLAAKATVFAATALVVGLFASFLAYFVGQAILSGQSLQSSIGDPHVLRAVVGGGLYLAALGLLGLGLGAIIRVSAGAISALFGLLFVLPIISALLPQSWQDTINPYLPFNAGREVFSVTHDSGMLGPWTGFGVFCLYAAVALLAAGILIRRRDA
ncbi:MAG: type transport system permease protein [Solirubrobacteraceae bacterium]|jgi:ABC-type transport system involved in multi-copper enzyme maturation permease subunit|nr:type transport system permease protein [Solirubrobacteraceae bacterium]MEA2354168.1 type transport system permease protein [Solirubrobacteraceae bacterium]